MPVKFWGKQVHTTCNNILVPEVLKSNVAVHSKDNKNIKILS